MIFVVLLLLIAVLLVLFPIRQVSGDSMYPFLKDGDVVIFSRIYKIEEGGIYMYKAPYNEKKPVIKRLAKVYGDRLVFLGDNSKTSYDSRQYGLVEKSQVVSRFIKRLK